MIIHRQLIIIYKPIHEFTMRLRRRWKILPIIYQKKKYNRILPSRGGYRMNLNNALLIELELIICRNICLGWRETHYVYRMECVPL